MELEVRFPPQTGHQGRGGGSSARDPQRTSNTKGRPLKERMVGGGLLVIDFQESEAIGLIRNKT